jgi:hypothetical protein
LYIIEGITFYLVSFTSIAESLNIPKSSRPLIQTNVQVREEMQSTTYTYQQMKDLGFQTKTTESYIWSEKDHLLLSDALKSIGSQKNYIHTQDPYYYLSHYIFDDTISPQVIKKRIATMIHE